MRILNFAAAIAAGVVALGVAACAYFLSSPDPTPPRLGGQVQTATIQVGSRLRSYVDNDRLHRRKMASLFAVGPT